MPRNAQLNRRHFGIGLGALAIASGLPSAVRAQGDGRTRTITTSAGTYDIPLDPKKVIAIDHRLDLEPALALGLTVVGYSLRDNLSPWVPVAEGTRFIGTPPTQELLLSEGPDLIFCTDIPGSEMWPIDKLSAVAPVIPVDYELDWKDNLARIGAWMDRTAVAEAFLADYWSQIEALKQKVGDKLARKVVAVWYEPENDSLQMLLGANTKNVTLAGQVLSDLGGVTLSDEILGDYGIISMENAPGILSDVDAILVDSFSDEQHEALLASPLWSRIPAVAAGKVVRSNGTFYGGGYSAKRLIGIWDQVFELL